MFMIHYNIYGPKRHVLGKELAMKASSTFYGDRYLSAVKENIGRYAWAEKLRDEAVEKARHWYEMADDDLWDLIFSNSIDRSHHVWSEGYCPMCKEPTPGMSWVVDAFKNPWKVGCPHCGELFPKNDFYGYYKSGLDASNCFSYDLADDALLTSDGLPGNRQSMYYNETLGGGGNSESPYYGFVDDGDGYMLGHTAAKRWRFIGAYLVYGQWTQLIIGGLECLSNAYLLTGDKVYARKTGILLDRIADLLPTFDYRRQGWVYEMPGDSGYVTTWHNSNYELRSAVFAYDAVFECIRDDAELVGFLSGKAKKHGLKNPKACFLDIQRNIEERIIIDMMKNPRKITLNFPGTELLLLICKSVLNRDCLVDYIPDILDTIISRGISVDGTTGEKGVGAYSSFTTNLVLAVIDLISMNDPDFAANALKKHPDLRKSFFFLAELEFSGKYYPLVGDAGFVASKTGYFQNVDFKRVLGGQERLGINLYSLIWRFYKITGDEFYLNILRRKGAEEEPVCDIGMRDSEEFYAKLNEGGLFIYPGDSFNLESWHLAALRHGSGPDETSVWIHYHGTHSAYHMHQDAMNIGLYARGLDLMAELGYPPVQYGRGWMSDYVKWYRTPFTHNTVIIDRNERAVEAPYPQGKTTVWDIGTKVKCLRVQADGYNGADRFDRTLCLVDSGDGDGFVIDVFRVAGGCEHIKHTHATYGTMSCPSAEGGDTLEFAPQILYSDVRGKKEAPETITADFTIEDRYGYLAEKRDIKLRYIELTEGCGAYAANMWINAGTLNEAKPGALPCMLIRRESNDVLESTFVSVLIPYEGDCPVAKVRKVYKGLEKGDAALEITMADGVKFLFVSLDSADGAVVAVNGEEINVNGPVRVYKFNGRWEPYF